jgi:hypothetical protein
MSGKLADIAASVEGAQSPNVPLEDVFVSLDIDANAADLVCEMRSGLGCEEPSWAGSEFLVAMGATSRIRLGSARTEVTSSHDGAYKEAP